MFVVVLGGRNKKFVVIIVFEDIGGRIIEIGMF